jgi:arginase
VVGTPIRGYNKDPMAKIKIIGVPMDLGASRRGVDMGPSAMRIARIGPRLKELGHEVQDYGNVPVRVAESIRYGDASKKFQDEIAEVCTILADATYTALKEGNMPLVLGGDHSIAIGTIAGVSRYYHEKGQKIGLIWMDAHGDINTPDTSVSGNIHGMPFATVLGHGAGNLLKIGGHSTPMVDQSKAVLVGILDLDPGEREMIRKLGIKAFTMRDIDEMGLRKVMDEAVRIASDNTIGFHASMDVDWLDPSEAPGVGTPVWGGATYREGHLAMEIVHDSGKMLSLEATEVNPVLDHENETAILATELILSAFGKKIL